jgi:hypothetical protein
MGSLRVLGKVALRLALALTLAAAPLRAAEIDKYLPEDTEVLSVLNVKQLLDSPLVKKYGLEQLKEALKGLDEVNTVLKDLDFDPFKDLDRILMAGPGGGPGAEDRGLIIVHGRFDLDKFRAKGEEAAKDNGEVLKIHKVPDGQGGKFLLYEVSIGDAVNNMPLFVALASPKTLLASFGKDYVIDALKRKDKPVLKDKDFQGMLEKMDPRATWAMAMVRGAWAKAEFPDVVKEALDNLEAIGGSLALGEDFNLELAGNAKNAKAARDVSEKINSGLTTGLGLLALLAGQQKELNPLLDVVKSIRVSARGKTVLVKLSISGDMIEKALNKDDKDDKKDQDKKDKKDKKDQDKKDKKDKDD